MKNLQVFITSLLFLIFATSCEFGDLNDDPTRQTAAELRNMLPAALTQTAFNLGAMGARMPGYFVQHFQGFDGQQITYSNYVINETTMNPFWNGGLYNGALRDCAVIIEQAEREGRPYYQGIANILFAINLGTATTFFGDVPLSQAFNSEILQPAFDSQESVYQSIQNLLDEAIILLGQSKQTGSPGSDDLIFGGDANRWIMTANSLKARYYLHLSKKDPNWADKALSAIGAGTFANSSEQPDFNFGTSQNERNPYALFAQQRPKPMVVSAFFENMLETKSDPRKAKYTVQDSDGDWLYYQDGNPNLFWVQNDAPIPLISLEEVLFIQAEAFLRKNDDANAIAALQNAITANMDRLGIPSGTSTTYTDQYGDFDGLTTFDEKLERIISEKYAALYCQGEGESWVDFRRTGYPVLVPALAGKNSFNPSGVIPTRFIYPVNERLFNEANLMNAVKNQGSGTGLLDDQLWMFQ